MARVSKKIIDKIKAANLVERTKGLFSKKATLLAFLYWVFIQVSWSSEFFLRRARQEKYFFYEMVQLAFLIFLFNVVAKIIIVARKNILYKKMLLVSIAYFGALMGLLILVWPGLYNWDDISILKDASYLIINPWQHFLTSVFHIVSLLSIPIASGPVIMSSIINSLLVGYVVVFLPNALVKDKKKRKLATIAVFISMLFPPVIFFALTGFRMAIYQYLEIFLLTFLIRHYRAKTKFSICGLLIFVIAGVLLCGWRTEGLCYVVFIPVLLWFFFRKLIGVKTVFLLSASIAVSSFLIIHMSNVIIGNDKYQLGAVILPATGITSGAMRENDEEALSKMSSVIDTDCLVEKGGMPEKVFWKCLKDDGGTNDYSSFEKDVVLLAPSYMRDILPLYRNILCDVVFGLSCGNSLEENKGTEAYRFAVSRHNGEESLFRQVVLLPFSKPFSETIRTKVINTLYGTTAEGHHTIFFYIFNTLWLPLVALIVAFVMSARNKNKLLLVMIIIVASRFPLVLLTGMTSYLMYFLPLYISAFSFCITGILAQRKQKKKPGKS